MQIHESAENYLETILMLSKKLPVVRSVDIANAWNREIRVEFLRAIKNMCPGIGAGHLPPEDELPMDTDMTYQLVCATRELDDMWYDFADHAVYVENEFGYPFFRTIVDEHTAACIKANPEAYLIARVTPK